MARPSIKRNARCVTANSEGLGSNSPLAGAAFLNRWTGQMVADLFMKTIVRCRRPIPGGSHRETADTVAYILSAYKYSPGQTELPSDP